MEILVDTVFLLVDVVYDILAVARQLPHITDRPVRDEAIKEKVLSMYAQGMITGDIETHIRDIYGIAVSDSTVSRNTNKVLSSVCVHGS